MQRAIRAAVLLSATVSLAASPQFLSAEGRNSKATLGSKGKLIAVEECPAGEVLVGFTGRTGAAIDAIQIICAAVLADGTYGAPRRDPDRYGGQGGQETTAKICDRNSRIYRASVNLDTTNSWVARATITCQNKDGVETGTVEFGGMSYIKEINNGPLKGDDVIIGASETYDCPNESFTGVRIRYDDGVRGMGFLCDKRVTAYAGPAVDNRPVYTTKRKRPSPVADAPPAPPAKQNGLRVVNVMLDVDVYAAPGGNGQAIGQLGAGTPNVSLVKACQNDWCNVRWDGQEGWVYSGQDYNSLGM